MATKHLPIVLLVFMLFTSAWAEEGGNSTTDQDATSNGKPSLQIQNQIDGIDTTLNELHSLIDDVDTALNELQSQIYVLLGVVDFLADRVNGTDTAIANLESENLALQEQIETLGENIDANEEKIEIMYKQFKFDFINPSTDR